MDDKALDSLGVVEISDQNETPNSDGKGNTSRDDAEMAYYGKRQQLKVHQPDEQSLISYQNLTDLAKLRVLLHRGICVQFVIYLGRNVCVSPTR